MMDDRTKNLLARAAVAYESGLYIHKEYRHDGQWDGVDLWVVSDGPGDVFVGRGLTLADALEQYLAEFSQ